MAESAYSGYKTEVARRSQQNKEISFYIDPEYLDFYLDKHGFFDVLLQTEIRERQEEKACIDRINRDTDNVNDQSRLETEIILGKLALTLNSNAKEVKVQKYAAKVIQGKTETIENGPTSQNGDKTLKEATPPADPEGVTKQKAYSAAIIAAAQAIPEDKRTAFLSHVQKLAITFDQEAKPAYTPRPLPESPAQAIAMGIKPYEPFTDVLEHIKMELAEWLPNEKNGYQRHIYRNGLGKFDRRALNAVKHQLGQRHKAGKSTVDIEALIPTVSDKQLERVVEKFGKLEDITLEDINEMLSLLQSAKRWLENPESQPKALSR